MNGSTLWLQKRLRLPAFRRGCHLVTDHVLDGFPELVSLETGILHVFIQHTSASLSLNENADSDVRRDMEMALSHLVPEDLPFEHTQEGADDMPAHIKSSLLGSSITIPLSAGRPCLGTWQGIYLCEHRNRAGGRSLVLTAWGAGG